MNKLYISTVSLGCGGAERVLSVLSDSFVAEFGHIKMFLWLDIPIFYSMNSNIEIINITKECRSNNHFIKMKWFREYIKKNKPDLLLSFLAKSSVSVILSTLGLGCRIVVAERNDPRNLKGGFIMKAIRDFLYNKAFGILEQTPNNKEYFKGTKYTKTYVIYNPVFLNDNEIGIGLSSEKKDQIVSVGRLTDQKDQIMLIKAFSIFLKAHPTFILKIFGEGELRSRLTQVIKEMGLENKVFLEGNVKDVVSNIKNSKAFALSSKFEGMPNALIEAMCVGIPVVSTKVSGAIDLIQDTKNGLLVDIGNYNQMAYALSCIIENEQLAYSMAKNASKLYRQLSVDNISKKWVSYLQSKMN